MFHFPVLAFSQFSQRSRTSRQLSIGHAMLMGRFWTALISIVIFAPCASSEQEYILAAPPWVQQEWDNSIHAEVLQIRNWDHPSVATGGNRMDRYSVCNFYNSKEPNNWLRSGLIPVRESGRLDVTIEYQSQQCPTLNFCRNSFYAYVWESNASLDASHIPNPISNYSLYRKFANISRLSDNRDTLTIPLQVTSKYIVLGFRDRGGCRTLYSVKVSYKVCTEKAALADSLVYLPRTFAQLAPITVEGRCAANSVQSLPGHLIVLCDSNGEWNTSKLEGRCICKKGKENIGGECADCRPGTFNEGRGLNCTAIPSEPRNTSVSFVNETSAVVTWLPPATTGYPPSTVFYDVDCRKTCEDAAGSGCGDQTCNSGIGAQLSMQGLNTTNFTATNLASFVNYTCNIKAGNRVSKIAETTSDTINTKKQLAVVTLRTEGSVPGTPEDVTVYLAEDDSINLSWTLKCKNGIIQKYVVQYFSVDDSSDIKTLTTKENEARIKNLVAGKTFEFQVYAVNEFGTGSPGVKTFRIPRGSSKNGSLPITVVAAAAGGGALILVIVAVTFFWYIFRIRRRSPQSTEKDYMRCLEKGVRDNVSMDQRRYIDPGNYLDLMELLATFTTEIERNKIKLDKMIGQGEFADVYKGILQTPKGKQAIAVKVLRPGSNEKNQKDFLSEASIMGQFNHPNVIQLTGVVTQSKPMMIVTEFLANGSLDYFLKSRKGELSTTQLLGIAKDVACGMVYLSEMNFIHRDLAARNILVGDNMSCKVSDFGLSRELADDNPESEYETQGGKIPVRWTAPEALQHRTFSSASDVWSYGILLWEIMSFADRPYWEWNNYDVINRVKTGYRLPPPMSCPKVVHDLMLNCWDSDKNKRLKFSDIVTRIDELLGSPDAFSSDLLPASEITKAESQKEFQSVDEWLQYISMEKYVDVFVAANINSLDKVTGLRDRELKKMGIQLIGHRNKISKSIKAMKGHSVNQGLDANEAPI
ncbi:ephrin type-A receptor 3-like isoform X3 [Montipora capricornis]|uniref:ephrin type-A receptor 3-like isoform X3 n=1 Tax=Montipora capricornis TaxID=246305 RepID=UPI0035F20274